MFKIQQTNQLKKNPQHEHYLFWLDTSNITYQYHLVLSNCLENWNRLSTIFSSSLEFEITIMIFTVNNILSNTSYTVHSIVKYWHWDKDFSLFAFLPSSLIATIYQYHLSKRFITVQGTSHILWKGNKLRVKPSSPRKGEVEQASLTWKVCLQVVKLQCSSSFDTLLVQLSFSEVEQVHRKSDCSCLGGTG